MPDSVKITLKRRDEQNFSFYGISLTAVVCGSCRSIKHLYKSRLQKIRFQWPRKRIDTRISFFSKQGIWITRPCDKIRAETDVRGKIIRRREYALSKRILREFYRLLEVLLRLAITCLKIVTWCLNDRLLTECEGDRLKELWNRNVMTDDDDYKSTSIFLSCIIRCSFAYRYTNGSH